MNTAVMGELEDWEMLQSPETGLVISGDSESLIIRSDYFIVDSNSYMGHHDTVHFDASLEPDQLVSADLVSESGTEVVVSPKVIHLEGKQGYLGCGENSPKVENKDYSGSTDGLLSEQFRGNNYDLGCEDDVCIEANGETQGVEVESNRDSGESLLASGVVSEMENSNSGGELVSATADEEMGNDGIEESLESVGGDGIEPSAVDELNSGEDGKRTMVWWKLPLELLKFCVFRVNPVWTVSVAAALMGLVILKRRLSRMKSKSRSIPIKLTVDDKKVSQFMMRASRLNEAFSVVRRVPVIRPLLPAAGVTPWPMANLR